MPLRNPVILKTDSAVLQFIYMRTCGELGLPVSPDGCDPNTIRSLIESGLLYPCDPMRDMVQLSGKGKREIEELRSCDAAKR